MAIDFTDKYATVEWKTKGGEYLNPNFVFLQEQISNFDEFVLQGSARSGKTWGVIYWIWHLIENYQGMDIGVCRENSPTLISTVLKDFVEVGLELKLYDERYHNKTRNIYTYNNNTVEFFALDDEGKARGRKRDILFMNEANRLQWDLVNQLMLRTTSKIIMDFNPSEVDSWIYDQILIRDTCAFLKTTYKNNVRFLPEKILKEMEYMRIHNPSLYRVFGLGERAKQEGQIYDNWRTLKEEEFDFRGADIWLMDFGATNDPTAIIRAKFYSDSIYAKEIHYGYNTRNHYILIHLFFNGYNEDTHTLIGDGGGMGASIIKELREGFNFTDDQIRQDCELLGYNIKSQEQFNRLQTFLRNGSQYIMGAIKRQGSIKGGIEKLKGYIVYLDVNSANAWDEYIKYCWKVDPKTRKPLGIPIDAYNHFMDALRYGALGHGRQH